MDSMDMDQDIPAIVEWVEERVRHYMSAFGKGGELKVIRHPNQDVQGVLVLVTIEGQKEPARLTVLEMHVKFDKPTAEAQIRGFVNSL